MLYVNIFYINNIFYIIYIIQGDFSNKKKKHPDFFLRLFPFFSSVPLFT